MAKPEVLNGARLFRFQPTAQQVDELIQRADRHPLGTEYLLNGYLDSVAATFKVHGFTVEHARERLRQGSGAGSAGSE